MLAFSFVDALKVAVAPAIAVTDATKELAKRAMATDIAQKYVCPTLKSNYTTMAKQEASKSPDARVQAAVIAADYLAQGCTDPLPAKSAQYPSGVPSSELAPKRQPGPQEFEIIEEPPFYKKTGFWIGVGLVAAAGAGTYVIFRRR